MILEIFPFLKMRLLEASSGAVKIVITFHMLRCSNIGISILNSIIISLRTIITVITITINTNMANSLPLVMWLVTITPSVDIVIQVLLHHHLPRHLRPYQCHPVLMMETTYHMLLHIQQCLMQDKQAKR